jgi:hypothetical protein
MKAEFDEPRLAGSEMRPHDGGSAPDESISRPDDRHIPVRFAVLADCVGEDLVPAGERDRLRSVAELMERIATQESERFEADILCDYERFDPDRATILVGPCAASNGDVYQRFRARINHLFNKANFEQIDETCLREAMDAGCSTGLSVSVNLEEIEDLELFFRGRGTNLVPRRRFRNWFRKQSEEVAVYRRLGAFVRRRGEKEVMIRLYKDIPEMDLEALLPGARARMSLKDRLTGSVGGAAAIGSAAFKLAGVGALLTSRVLWVLLTAGAAATGKTVLGYRRLREVRTGALIRNLYYCQLANNATVIHSLTESVAESEAAEALLTYCFSLWGGAAVTDEGTLDRAVERYLHERFGVTVDFEHEDGIESLRRWGLWRDEERLEVLRVEDAGQILLHHWREEKSAGYHLNQAQARQV